MSPTETAKRYIALFNARKFREMGELFAADSLWEPPSDTPAARGREAIIAGYSAMADQEMTVTLTDARFHEQGNTVIVEMLADTPDGPMGRVADVFEVDDEGRILRMTGYTGPPN
ncbi:MAG: nuclear transport factor 2 family protein [Candidatus Nanopelagicales bacterium]